LAAASRARRILPGRLFDPVRGRKLGGRSNGSRIAANICSPPIIRAKLTANSNCCRGWHDRCVARQDFWRYGCLYPDKRWRGSGKAAQFLHGLIAFPASKSTSRPHDKQDAVGTYRAPGRFEANFFRERLLIWRRRILNSIPSRFAARTDHRSRVAVFNRTIGAYEGETAFDTGDYHEALDRCLEEFGWDSKIGMQGRLIDGRYHGLSTTCFVESGGAGPRENVRFVLEPRATSQSMSVRPRSTGIETAFTQIAADVLGLPFESVSCPAWIDDIVHEGFGTYHSRALVMVARRF